MFDVPVFAGLGSDALFSRDAVNTVLADCQTLEANLILRECFQIFHYELQHAIDSEILSRSSIDLGDFPHAEKLIDPPEQYQRHILIQHVTLFLTQVSRFAGHRSTHRSVHSICTSGFCVGLLPAAAVATSSDLSTFVSQSRRLFHTALQLGIHCEAHRQGQIHQQQCEIDDSWSIVVDGIPSDQATNIVGSFQENAQTQATPIEPGLYVSAINTDRCVTISGHGANVRRALQEHWLPAGCRTKKTNVYTTYHHREHLNDVHTRVLQSIRRSMSNSELHAKMDFATPLISPIDGHILGNHNVRNLDELIESIVDSILLEVSYH